jgi:hypothetical protein
MDTVLMSVMIKDGGAERGKKSVVLMLKRVSAIVTLCKRGKNMRKKV